MTPEDFAEQFQHAFQSIYLAAMRRVRDGRQRLAPETTALLLHLAEAGPMSLSDMAKHFDRALSTLSDKVENLETQGLLQRQRDPHDARRSDIWLSELGQTVLAQELDVLDRVRVTRAAASLSAETRTRLLDALTEFDQALTRGKPHEP